MRDIRNKIYRKVFTQCLKMIPPQYRDKNGDIVDTPAYGYYKDKDADDFPERIEITEEELIALSDADGMDGRIIKDIRSGSPDLANISMGKESLPILFLEIGTGGLDFEEERIEQRMRGELFHVIIRTVVGKPSELKGPVWKESAPVQLLTIREQLEYLLDISVFRGILATRVGYELPSIVYSCGIMSSESLEGMPASYDAMDYRWICEFHKQIQQIDFNN